MKPLKDRWDNELIKWQRLHVGAKLPKPEFARILTNLWDNLNPVIIENFDALSWSKWEIHLQQQSLGLDRVEELPEEEISNGLYRLDRVEELPEEEISNPKLL
ncbi:unnamed protein product [Colias eurytheme]|nr:unnamed protein product [Colias eurytheme]